ncbi:cysteine synthase family protein [Candidatus Obscuribacterales bacterium]|nr:cysteine synthase family protein [Candidatus Obscuribacterales bacterium]MBX3149776.1 cysteine synthase family protein [Candidatus Obscuribacterales bacterium]
MTDKAIANSLEELIGNTPIIRLSRFCQSENLKHTIFGKCEFLNPGGSVKDRIAFHMVRKAEETGRLKPGGTIIEATAGNTGIGLAQVAAVRGYKLITVMSEKVSKDKVNFLRALGAETVVLPGGKPISDPDNFMNRARKMAEDTGAWLANQFYNETNAEAHYQSTGPEVWTQTGGEVDALVAGVGTGGTLSGTGRYLKEQKPEVQVVLADPIGSSLADLVQGKESKSGSYLVEGIGQDFIPGNFDISLIDDVVRVADKDAVAMSKKVLATEGLFLGSSSGCIIAAAVEYSRRLSGENKNIVAILPDGGRGYLSTMYNEEWLSLKLGPTQ